MASEHTIQAVAALLRERFDSLSAERCHELASKGYRLAREDGNKPDLAMVESYAMELAYDAELALEDDGVGASDLEDISAGEWQSDLEDAWRS